jgi:hypothetical protein
MNSSTSLILGNLPSERLTGPERHDLDLASTVQTLDLVLRSLNSHGLSLVWWDAIECASVTTDETLQFLERTETFEEVRHERDQDG